MAGKVNPMSHPALQPHFATSEIPEVARLKEAIEWCKNMRIRVVPSAPPVECASTMANVRWVRRDPDAVIDPIGAVILMRQPHATELPDAAAEALNSTLPCAEGIADGLAGESPSQSWSGSHASRLYLPGYIAGVELRARLLTWACGFHQLRMPLGEQCPACLRALS